jgi:hypothetical protein
MLLEIMLSEIMLSDKKFWTNNFGQEVSGHNVFGNNAFGQKKFGQTLFDKKFSKFQIVYPRILDLISPKYAINIHVSRFLLLLANVKLLGLKGAKNTSKHL